MKNHWGWYWKIKLKHEPKKNCTRFDFLAIDSFAMYKPCLVSLVHSSQDRISFSIPKYDLQAYLQDNDSLFVSYNKGEYIIPVEKKSCNFGGFYCFFCCPQCARRQRKLYCIEGKYICRKCAKLGYYTQRLRPSRRALLMGYNLKKYLKNRGGSLEKKPPKMHQNTFQKLQNKYLHYDRRFVSSSAEELLLWYGAKAELYL